MLWTLSCVTLKLPSTFSMVVMLSPRALYFTLSQSCMPSPSPVALWQEPQSPPRALKVSALRECSWMPWIRQPNSSPLSRWQEMHWLTSL